ncbi:MAG: DUF2339 domain-containing protein [Cytophagaceae bacterium]
MEAIILIVLAILVVPIIILITIKSSINGRLDDVSRKLEELRKEVRQMNVAREVPVAKAAPEPPREVNVQVEKAPLAEVVKPVQDSPVPAPKPAIPVSSHVPPQRPPVKPAPKEKRKSFLERNPDMEKFIGENLMNKIGIVILVAGIAIFVKYAIDKDWIGPVGRVMIAVLSGGMLVGVAHYLRKNYKSFSSVLLGGGIAVLYLSVAMAFHFYSLISQPVAFGIMVLITAFTVGFSLLYNRMEIAILAILGGFGTPFMVSTGEGDYVILFSYILLLNTGMLVLAWFRKWYPINVICYVLTILLYGGWFGSKVVGSTDAPVIGALVFASLFFLVFVLMNVVYNLKNSRKFDAFDFSIILSNTFLYFGAGLYCIDVIGNGAFNGLFTASIAIFFFVSSFVLYKNSRIDRNLVFLFIGLILTFLSLAAPIQLKGNHITLFWAAEAVLLLWLSLKSELKILKTGSAIVLLLMAFSLLMDWGNVYKEAVSMDVEGMNIIFNKHILTGLISALSVFMYMRLINAAGEKLIFNTVDALKNTLFSAFLVICYATLLLEINYHLHISQKPVAFLEVAGWSFTGVYLLVLFLLVRLKIAQFLKPALVVLSLLSMVYAVFDFHSSVIDLRDGYQMGEYPLYFFLIHLINVFALTALLFFIFPFVKEIVKNYNWDKRAYPVFALLMLLFFISSELDHFIVLSHHPNEIGEALSISHKVAYPIAWGIFSFVLMIVGMKRKQKYIRFASLILICVTLVKLFVYDIKNASEGGKIAAFISLGLLLLIISFLYQKLKNLLIDGNSKTGGTVL